MQVFAAATLTLTGARGALRRLEPEVRIEVDHLDWMMTTILRIGVETRHDMIADPQRLPMLGFEPHEQRFMSIGKPNVSAGSTGRTRRPPY